MANPPTVILAIENSNPSTEHGEGDGPGVALGRITPGTDGAEVLGVEFLRPAGRHDDDLMSAIDRLSRAVRIKPDQIGQIAVSIGPGGYTALRIAIATAKMIAEAVGARTVAVPSAEVAARRVSPEAGAGDFAVALASKGETVFLTVFGADRQPRGAGRVVTPDDFDRLTGGQNAIRALISDRFIADNFHHIAERAGLHREALRLHPVACMEAVFALPLGDPIDLAPFYAREPEAVTLWRSRKS